eukprot:PhF_6_TR141/c0_g1_i1/m.77
MGGDDDDDDKPKSAAMAAQQCVRCGSKEHSTRDHDEGKIGGGAASAAKPKPKPKPKAAVVGKQGIVHPFCWQSVSRNCGIPETIVARPDRRAPYVDPHGYEWSCRANCTCLKCQKKKRDRAMYAEERRKKSLGIPLS